MTTAIECAYLPPDATGELTQLSDTTAWIESHGCHELATWAIVTPGARLADATYACARHVGELLQDGDTVRVVDGEVGR